MIQTEMNDPIICLLKQPKLESTKITVSYHVPITTRTPHIRGIIASGVIGGIFFLSLGFSDFGGPTYDCQLIFPPFFSTQTQQFIIQTPTLRR